MLGSGPPDVGLLLEASSQCCRRGRRVDGALAALTAGLVGGRRLADHGPPLTPASPLRHCVVLGSGHPLRAVISQTPSTSASVGDERGRRRSRLFTLLLLCCCLGAGAGVGALRGVGQVAALVQR